MTLAAYDCCTDAVTGAKFRFSFVYASGIKKDGKSKAQALKALKSVKRSTWRQSRKPRYSTVFHRPKTFEAPRKPKYPRLRYKWGQGRCCTAGSDCCGMRMLDTSMAGSLKGPAQQGSLHCCSLAAQTDHSCGQAALHQNKLCIKVLPLPQLNQAASKSSLQGVSNTLASLIAAPQYAS